MLTSAPPLQSALQQGDLFSSLFGAAASSDGQPGGFASLITALQGVQSGESAGQGFSLLEGLGLDAQSLLNGEQDLLPEGLTNQLQQLVNQGNMSLTERAAIEQVVTQVQHVVIELTITQIDITQINSAASLEDTLLQLGMLKEAAERQAALIDQALRILQGQGLDLGESYADKLQAFLPSSQQVTQIRVQHTEVTVDVQQVIARQHRQAAFTSSTAMSPVLNVAERALQDGPLLPAQAVAAEGEIETGLERAEVRVNSRTEQIAARAQPLAQALQQLQQAAQPVAMATATAADVVADVAVASQAAPALAQEQSTTPLLGSTPETSVAAQALQRDAGVPRQEVGTSRYQQNKIETKILSADAVLPGVKGQPIYQWSGTTGGADALIKLANMDVPADPAVTANQAAEDAALEGLDLARQPAAKVGTPANAPANSFAERLMAARQAQVGQQVQVQMKGLAEQGGGTIRMSLKPANLGTVHVQLEIMDGRVQGSIAVQNPEVVEQLARELHVLKQGLTDAGFDLNEQGIQLVLDQEGENQYADDDDANADDQQFAAAEEATDDAAPDAAARWTAPDRLLDVDV
jgi:flagellar hook-length control protein FliK